jgi:alpha-L-fucosidase
MKHVGNEKPWVVTFSADDRLEDKLKKAAHVKPSSAQLAWMEKEYIAFIHFGPNTFSKRQWGTGKEEPSAYAPKALDPSQWARVCAQAGMKMAIVTFKHHDGFCQWFTDTTEHSTLNAPVKKDLAKLMQQGCDANQIELGVYLSPWDMYQRERGLWNTKEYNSYFLSQLRELLTRYGRVNEVWFDGACGDYEIWKSVPTYRPEEWYDYIEELQPDAVYRMYDPYFFASKEKWEELKAGNAELEWRGKAVRWVGNEEGKSRTDEWSVQPVFDREIAQNATYPDLGEEKYYEKAVGAVWYPLEVNTTILNQWFYNPETSKVKSLEELIAVYYNSIGNNGILLLNISPDQNGLVPEDQIQRLMELKEFVQRTFSCNLAAKAKAHATMEAPAHEASYILDQDKMTYWTTDGEWDINKSSASITIDLGQSKTFDNVMLQEYIREGQRVAEWSLEAWDKNGWRELVHHKTIGYKNIKRFEQVTTDRVRLNILRSWDKPMLSGFGLYLTDLPEQSYETEDIVNQGPDPVTIDSERLLPQIEYTYYSRGLQSAGLIEDMASVTYENTGLLSSFHLLPTATPVDYSLSYKGYLRVPQDGIYTFVLESADGSMMILDGKLFIDNDEPHEVKAVERRIALKAGYYPIKILYTSFRNAGLLKVSWSGPGFELQEIAVDYLFHTV